MEPTFHLYRKVFKHCWCTLVRNYIP